MTKQQYSKDKGRAWENDVVRFQREHGAPHAERKRQRGARDEGDTTGIPGVVTECKHERSYKLPEWVRELETEIANAGVTVGAVWARQNGKPGGEQGFVITSPRVWMILLREAGYLD